MIVGRHGDACLWSQLLGRLRQEDCRLEGSLRNLLRPYLQKVKGLGIELSSKAPLGLIPSLKKKKVVHSVSAKLKCTMQMSKVNLFSLKADLRKHPFGRGEGANSWSLLTWSKFISFAQHFFWEMHRKPCTCGLDNQVDHQLETFIYIAREGMYCCCQSEGEKTCGGRWSWPNLAVSFLTYKAEYRPSEKFPSHRQTHGGFCCMHFFKQRKDEKRFWEINTIPVFLNLKSIQGKGWLRRSSDERQDLSFLGGQN